LQVTIGLPVRRHRRLHRLGHQGAQTLITGRIAPIVQAIEFERLAYRRDVVFRRDDSRFVRALEDARHDQRRENAEDDDDDQDFDQRKAAQRSNPVRRVQRQALAHAAIIIARVRFPGPLQMRFVVGLLLLALVGCGVAYWWATTQPLHVPADGYALTVKPGATLRSVARDLTAADVVPADWTLVALARLSRADRTIKAGNYEIGPGTTLAGLMAKLTQGDVTQSSFANGPAFDDLKAALKSDAKIAKR